MNKELPDHYIRIHNHGFVGYLEHMGSDAAIVAAARTSYAGETTVTRNEIGLINYLMRNQHTSPFEMAEVKFHIRAPIFVFRQLVRHRTANLNEESGRYSVLADDYFVPTPESVTGQSASNKQMSGGEISHTAQHSTPGIIDASSRASFEAYDYLLKSGVAREMARVVLPLGTYSTVVWKCDLHNLLRMLRLRLDVHAQQEIRDYAQAIFDIVKPLFPHTVAAWENYVRNAVTFSEDEQSLLRTILQNYTEGELRDTVLTIDPLQFITKREFDEFMAKLIKIAGI